MIVYPCDAQSLLALLGSAALGQGKARPNILFIMADDHAAHAISAYGSRISRTPNIDRIAQGGLRRANCFCTNSICTPSRAAILTGQYSHKNGVYTLEDPLDSKRDTVAKQLQTAGYQTASAAGRVVVRRFGRAGVRFAVRRVGALCGASGRCAARRGVVRRVGRIKAGYFTDPHGFSKLK